MLRRILHKFGLAWTKFKIQTPTQDSWYPLDPCGENEDNGGDKEEHDEDKDTTEMDEDKKALTTESKSIWN